MRNKYEFKVEDINTVYIRTNDSYNTLYIRKTVDSQLTRDFIVQYSAPVEDLKDGKVRAICRRCERWNNFDIHEFMGENFVYKCNHCTDDYEYIISENELIDIIQSNLNEEVYFYVEIIINGIKIE